MASILLDGVAVQFPQGPALRDLHLHIADGEFFVLLGPSGSGKSTVLRVIAGLDSPQRGDVLFDGKPVNHVPTAERNVAMIFQDNVLYPNMEVRRNIGFPLWARKVGREEIDQRVEAESRVLDIERLLERMPSELSAGHQQLVQAAKAMVRVPDVFLMDEPVARLDAGLRARARNELKTLQQGYGVTTLYATNDQNDAMALADRLGVLGEGRLRQVGAPLEVYHEPADTFAAESVGSPTMNLVPARVVQSAQGFMVETAGGSSAPLAEAAPWVGEEVLLGFRADDAEIGEKGAITATVDVIETAGDRALVRGSIGPKEIVIRAGEQPPRPGTSVQLLLKRYHLFSVSDGRALLHISSARRHSKD